jgi:MFS superfamily sulfate permease-like transporter
MPPFNFSIPKKVNFKNEILAGLTVAMTMIPESLSFAILAGLAPLMGLYAAFLMGLVTAILGGRPGMVSGGAGATIVVLIALIASHGVEYLLATVILAGVLQFLVGVFKLGKFVRLIPQPVMYGFLNGLAIIIFRFHLAKWICFVYHGRFSGIDYHNCARLAQTDQSRSCFTHRHYHYLCISIFRECKHKKSTGYR